jgi:hypothetical protein
MQEIKKQLATIAVAIKTQNNDDIEKNGTNG